MKYIFLILIMFLKITFVNAHQDTTIVKVKKEWGNFGIGASSVKIIKNTVGGINFGINYYRSVGNNFYQIGFDETFSVFGGNRIIGNINTGIGKRIFNKYFLGAGFIGPNFVFGKIRDDNKHFFTIGIASNIQIIFKPIKDFGIGTELFANLNFKVSTIGFRLILHISNAK